MDAALLRDLHLLTAKPFIYVFNVDEDALGDADLAAGPRRERAPGAGRSCSAPRSRRRWPASTPADAAELLRSYGQEESGLEQLVHVGFATLGLQTFLTAGPKEARAWTIHIGDTAPKAAGVIHTDFERGFIKAEVISFDDLMEAGSVAAARTAGKARMEGKDYVMRDGDVVEFRFNTEVPPRRGAPRRVVHADGRPGSHYPHRSDFGLRDAVSRRGCRWPSRA